MSHLVIRDRAREILDSAEGALEELDRVILMLQRIQAYSESVPPDEEELEAMAKGLRALCCGLDAIKQEARRLAEEKPTTRPRRPSRAKNTQRPCAQGWLAALVANAEQTPPSPDGGE